MKCAPNDHPCVWAMWAALVLVPAAYAGEWNCDLPEGGVGFKFGPTNVAGLTNVTAKSVFGDQGPGFVSTEGLLQGGGAWPDALSGSYMTGVQPGAYGRKTKDLEFRARVPNGKYVVWLCGGKVIDGLLKERHYLLKINDVVLCDEKPGDEEFAGEKYLCRFMRTVYSERPHALWEDFIDKMYPCQTATVEVTDGILAVKNFNALKVAYEQTTIEERRS